LPACRSLALAATLTALVVPAPSALAAAPKAPKPKHLQTRVLVKRFVATKTGLSALGTASTSVNGASTRQTVTLKATTGSSCQVLSLHLDRLNLALLGLRLDVSTVNLQITGNRARTLGALFCKLATATKLRNLAGARAAAASLNSRLRRRALQMVSFRANLYPQTARSGASARSASVRAAGSSAPLGPTCPVLDLTLGPLNLDLLGLVVDLYGKTAADPVQVTAVADPAAGILGKALCQISTQQPQ